MDYGHANPNYDKKLPSPNYSVVVVKCHFWPGAYTFFCEG